MTFAADRALKCRILLFTGDESALRDRAFESLLAAAEVHKDDFDLQNFDGDSSLPMDWYNAASTAPFFADRRTVIVRHLLRCEPDKAKAIDFGNLPESSLLILVADDEGGSDDKVARAKTAAKNWEKVVTKASGHVASFVADMKQSCTAVRAEIAVSGKTISEKALDALIEMTGSSLSRALDELVKLLLYIGDQDQIRESDVRQVVIPSREWNVFKLVDAIVGGNVPEALTQLRTLIGNVSKAEDAAFRSILPMMARQIRLLWQARLLVEANCGLHDVPDSILASLPEKPNILKETYRARALLQGARKTSLPQLAECLDILSDTDARLKGILTSFSAQETLERMVLDMAEALTRRPVVARR